MKFTLSWLKEHLENAAEIATLTKALTALGLEVEGVADRTGELAPFTVGHVLEARPHPNADKLSVCDVDTGHGIVQVVCGAPNARTGMRGVFAPVGCRIPGTGIELKAGNIRGIESNGMLCSMREMDLGQDHDGIIDLAQDAPIGMSFAAYMNLDDPVIEVAVTPDRADCLGVRGIARDLAAAGHGTLRRFALRHVEGTFVSPLQWRLDEAGSSCPLVAGRFFRNVTNGESPRWMRDRLSAIGLRPISALVDITNYVTIDLGRPLHVFDADKLKGDPTMRLAREGETLQALDGKEYSLDPTMTVIADENGPAAIGGIMGGEPTGCSEATTNVFLEVALFDAQATARAGRALGINSDARFRFERGVDPLSAKLGLDVATKLITKFCGAEPSRVTQSGAVPKWERGIEYRPARVLGLGGLDVAPDRQKTILGRLGFIVAGKSTDRWSVTPPSWRPDVEGEADLVEEVLRITGFDAIPALSLPRETALPHAAISAGQRRVLQAKRILAVRGLLEAVTYSFMPSAIADLFSDGAAPLALANPISAELDCMRPSILGNLLLAASRNASRGFPDLGLFEIGPAYRDATEKGQLLVATGLRVGLARPRNWEGRPREADAFDAKTDALALMRALVVPVENIQITQDAPVYYHPGRSGAMRLGPGILAFFGELHPRILKATDFKGAAAGFEVFMENLPMARTKGNARPLLDSSPFQPLERDFAFVVDEKIAADRLVKAAKGADRALISEVRVFDAFQGGNLPEGKKSIAFSVTLQPRERTLTDAEIEAVSAKIVAAINKATGGELRK